MFYDRKIKYLDYYEGGTRVSGCGFAKLEVRDGILRLEMTVRGLHPTDSFERDVVLRGAEKEETLGPIRIQNGSGLFHYSGSVDKKIGVTDISYGELSGIRISIGGTREILCEWENAPVKTAKAPQKPKSEEVKEKSESEEAKGNPKEKSAKEADVETSDVREENAETSVEMEGVETEAGDCGEEAGEEFTEREIEERELVEKPNTEKEVVKKETIDKKTEERETKKKATVKLLEDKWQQLSAIYPHIQPFQDERDYLSLTPSDFVLFPTRFYRAVNNSFLLHGYYNYHHLILARVERRGEILYYIGVPGNYYEREKQVAIMFGFESFECEAEPAKTGDFGYYLMRTEL